MKMVRKQIYIEPEQEELLKRKAKTLGLSEAELIRHAIANFASVGLSLPRDRQAWERELAFIEERARCLPDLGGKRTWTREQLYEERLERFSR
jgi:hypothetical protein